MNEIPKSFYILSVQDSVSRMYVIHKMFSLEFVVATAVQMETMLDNLLINSFVALDHR